MALRIVNTIPATLSGETGQDSEPSVTVNPANPQQAAVTAFTNDPASSGSAPIYVSTDGGQTWALNVCVPGGNATGDISVRFAGAAGALYGGILRQDTGNLNILRATAFPPAGLMTTLVNRAGVDQPWVEASWAGGAGGAAVERVFVTSNAARATMEFSLDAATAAPPAGFGAPLVIDLRAGSNRPSVRSAVHRAGVVYALFVGVRPGGSDIVVVRDDNWGSGGFANLVDPGDGVAGRRIVTGVTVPPVGTLLGSVRVSSRLAIAVDPRNRNRVYVAWCDGQVTPASPFTLHLRRSDDGGLNWTADLRTITNVTNPGLAVNIRGTAGLSYQRLITPVGGNRFQTHFEISDDFFATVRADTILASLQDLGGTFQPTIGDYANLIAVGKDFYGVFSGFNQPVSADFPNGVTYQRNADFVNQRLLANNGVTVVANSIDTFFFHWSEVEPENDFYVRDWTDNAATADTGVEPSIRPVFYATSDVWNRRGTAPGPFVNDQPSNEDAGNGAGNIGDNWAFTRIRRRAAATTGGPITVTAHFLVSKLGTGSNYVDASSADPDVSFPDPDPTVVFNPADVGPVTTASFHWHLNPVSSTHLCLAVEISAPGDPFAGATLRGRAPGWPDQDLEVIDDNNKAQRNMGLSVTPARGTESAEMCLFGIAHNADIRRRDMVLRYVVDPKLRERVKDIQIEVVGGKPLRADQQGTFVLEGMNPGENRWIGVSFRPPRGEAGQIYPVFISEMIGQAAVNGFGLGARVGSTTELSLYALERHRSVFTRLATGLGIKGAEAEVTAAIEGMREKGGVRWLKGLQDRRDSLTGALREIAGAADPFGIADHTKALARALRGAAATEIMVTLCCLLERADSQLTMRQLDPGDRADILQTVRWQAELFDPRSPLAKTRAAADIRRLSQEFVAAYAARKIDDAAYAKLLSDLLPAFELVGKSLRDAEFKSFTDAVPGLAEDPARLQGAHRRLLLHLAQ